jgi:fluoride ion exporter CrcB/FEX
MGGGAWPFLVGGVICLVNSDNERDLNLLNTHVISELHGFLEGLTTFSGWKFEAITGL